MLAALPPLLLLPVFSRRPWGRADLSPWYSAAETGEGAEPVGEAWLTGPQCIVAAGPLAGQTLAEITKNAAESLLGDWQGEGEYPLLTKLLFPDGKLSVQVHPDDEAAHAIGEPRGKTECWYVVAAEPGATVGCGLLPGVAPAQMRAAVADGTMESLLRQLPVTAGEMVYVDAGTVHAIAPGVTLLETQQTSDTTYRLYDYGRPRELHLDQGIAVCRTETRAGKIAPWRNGEGDRLIQERYFTVDRYHLPAGEKLLLEDATGRPHGFTVLEGGGRVRTESGEAPLKRAASTILAASSVRVQLVADADMVIVRSMP